VLFEGFPDQPRDEALVFRRTEEAKQWLIPCLTETNFGFATGATGGL
jgi:hypothetical protein